MSETDMLPMAGRTRKHTQALRAGFARWSESASAPPAMGDMRWPADLILATWSQAGSGAPPEGSQAHTHGHSDGGFDRLDFKWLPDAAQLSGDTEVDLAIPLNRRPVDPKIEIPVPWYGAGMSYGSVSEQVMLARAMAAQQWGTFTSTGEGGYPDSLLAYKEHVITQVATGMFGVREETLKAARIIEFKYAQGAKPGLGGHLLGDKATVSVAKMRQSVPWVSLFSPFPFHSVYSVEDHRKHVDWVKTINPLALVSIKVSTPTDVDMVAVGSYFAGAHILHIDGSYGGTGAAPEIAKKNIAMPIEYAIPRVHRYLRFRGHPGRDDRHGQRRHPNCPRHRQGDRVGRRWRHPWHQRIGGHGMHSLLKLRTGARLPVWFDHHRPRTRAASRPGVGGREGQQPLQRLRRRTVSNPAPARIGERT